MAEMIRWTIQTAHNEYEIEVVPVAEKRQRVRVAILTNDSNGQLTSDPLPGRDWTEYSGWMTLEMIPQAVKFIVDFEAMHDGWIV